MDQIFFIFCPWAHDISVKKLYNNKSCTACDMLLVYLNLFSLTTKTQKAKVTLNSMEMYYLAYTLRNVLTQLSD